MSTADHATWLHIMAVPGVTQSLRAAFIATTVIGLKRFRFVDVLNAEPSITATV